jgi:hypothetical protein
LVWGGIDLQPTLASGQIRAQAIQILLGMTRLLLMLGVNFGYALGFFLLMS